MTFSGYSEYKDSGEEWLGKVPKHWSIAPLKSSASCNDTVLPESTDDEYEIDYVEISDVNEISGITGSTRYKFSDAPSRARRMLRHGDVLISTVRTYLRAIAPVVSPPENLIASTGFAVVRPREDILDGTFLGYLLRAEWWISQIIARSVGVSYPAINASDLIGLSVPLPTWHEQTRIARFLNHETARIDAMIEEQQRLIELLKEKRQAVISHAVTKGLDPTVTMKDSGVEWLGAVPAHWERKRLKNISPFIAVGIVVNPSEFVAEDGLPFIYGGEVKEGVIEVDKARKISPEHSLRNRKTMLEADDLVTMRVGYPGLTAVVPPSCEGGNCASVMLVKRGNFDSRWLCAVMNSRLVRQQVEVVQYGAAQKQFNIADAVEFWMYKPPLDEQSAIAQFVAEQSLIIDDLSAESEKSKALLQERRSALISAAVTGKIDVRGWKPTLRELSRELAEEAV
ncbi:restriction endonuclease subunit S [Pseudomonas graminis]|uniref:Type-1 restriction enzyme EcoKI specificity protein n=1 Tax=Pseudomonas graminis TaxID=158627 RepID=A0A6M8MFY7_9PSED|nr:restriction endonuclease subunit S [Pseudomonas graminis]QKF50040.1 Type-1 restriction enzyme EcoKI specificity protein [Pseudomonas graminis]